MLMVEQVFSFIPLFLILIFLLVAAFFGVWVFLCVWVYRDANKHGMDGTLWLIIVLFTHLIGLIIYLIVRKPETVPGPLFP
jgi:hypothetical protein